MQLQDSDDIVELKKAYSRMNRSHRVSGTEQLVTPWRVGAEELVAGTEGLVAPWRVGTEGLVTGTEELVNPWRGEFCGLHFSLGEFGLCSPRIERQLFAVFAVFWRPERLIPSYGSWMPHRLQQSPPGHLEAPPNHWHLCSARYHCHLVTTQQSVPHHQTALVTLHCTFSCAF